VIFHLSRQVDSWIASSTPGFLSSGQFWALCITPLLLAAILFGLRRRVRLLAAVALAALLAARLPLFCRDHLGVDEAFLLSSAMRAAAGQPADSGTSGPLNIWILTVPAWFGSPLTYASARLTAILLMSGALGLLFLALGRFLDHALAALAVVPMVCFAAYARELDFTHASSEHLPVFLCAAACCLLARDYAAGARASLLRSVAIGALLPAMVFAKLQALPLAATLLLLAAASAWRKSHRWYALAALSGGGALVPAALLAWFARTGILREFWYSYLGRNLAYTGLSGLSTVAKFSQAAHMLFFDSNLNWYTFGLAPVWLAGLGAAAVVMRSRGRISQTDLRNAVVLSVGALLLVSAGFAAVATPGKPFPHYLLFLLIPFACLTASALLWLRLAFPRSFRGLWLAVFLAITCCVPTILTARTDDEYETAWDTPVFNPATPLAGMIQRYVSPRESLAVWGWRSELYVASRRVPGTRFADSVLQIEPSPYLPYFRQVYLADFLRSRPPVFIDAVGPAAFAYRDRATQGFETFQALRQAVLQDYRPLGEYDGARVFVRNNPQ
jgi:hypothetical protein